MLASAGRAELAQRTLLDLAHPLGAEPNALSHVTQRLLRAVEPVAGAEDHPLAVVEAAQQRSDLLDLGVIK
jgi:hypothetical protein